MSTVLELQKQLDEAKAIEYKAVEAQRIRINNLRLEFFATQPFKYEVTPIEISNFNRDWSEDVDIVEKIRIIQHIVPTKATAFAKANNLHVDDLQHKKSPAMNYYLTLDGIIHHSGGGAIILKTPQLCTAFEWAQIKHGDIPEKFLRSA